MTNILNDIVENADTVGLFTPNYRTYKRYVIYEASDVTLESAKSKYIHIIDELDFYGHKFDVIIIFEDSIESGEFNNLMHLFNLFEIKTLYFTNNELEEYF